MGGVGTWRYKRRRVLWARGIIHGEGQGSVTQRRHQGQVWEGGRGWAECSDADRSVN